MRNLKIMISAVAISAIAGVAAASAADLPARTSTKAPVMVDPVYRWTGVYIGGNAGGAWGRSDVATTTTFVPLPAGYFGAANIPAVNAAGTGTIKPNSFTGGGQIGYNWQFAPTWVAGVEADLSYFHLSGSRTAAGAYPTIPVAGVGFNFQESVQTNWLFTARPRIGWANNNWLFYATGGVAVTQLKYNSTFTDNAGGGFPSGMLDIGTPSTTKVGWTIGGGVEAALWAHWAVKAEYLYVNFGSVTGASTNSVNPAYALAVGGPSINPFSHSANLTANILRVGLNYHL